MAAFSLLALLDDITSVLDDVALLTKTAVKKTAGVLGDDLALNARQVSGVRSDREWPVIWAVAKGSLVNKALLIPAALFISAWWPKLITPLLMLGGAYLCWEGAEKLAHLFFHKAGNKADSKAPPPEEAPPENERDKIRGAIRTDFILSAEIIVIALGNVPYEASLALRAGVLVVVGLLMTVGVYGLVGGIVKLDDLGLWLLEKSGGRGWKQRAGALLLGAAPLFMRFLSAAGTAAMFLVGGGILLHGLPFAHHLLDVMASWPVNWLLPPLVQAAIGLAAGSVLLAASTLVQRIRTAL